MTKPMGNRAAAQTTSDCRDCARSSASVFRSRSDFPPGLGKSKRIANPDQQSRRERYQENLRQSGSELCRNVGPGQALGGEDFAPMRKRERGGMAGKVGECEHELRKRIADLQPRP